MKPINIIVACAANGVIGRAGRLPWSIPEDWRYFLETTRGGILVMGRIAFEEMVAVGEVVKGDRTFIVVSRSGKVAVPDGDFVHLERSLPEALDKAGELPEPGPVWICGGEGIYRESLPLAERLFITEIQAEVEGDVYFPEWRHLDWIEESQRPGRDENFEYTFRVLKKDTNRNSNPNRNHDPNLDSNLLGG